MTDRPNDDVHLPASEVGTGIIPEEGESAGGDVHHPASEDDRAPLRGEGGGGEPQSWPGKGFGSIPPPG
jgi:hypothetical protein